MIFKISRFVSIVTVQTYEKTKTAAEHDYYLGTGFLGKIKFSKYQLFRSLEIPSILDLVCQKPNISHWREILGFSIAIQGFYRNTRFFIWNTKFFIGHTRYFKNMWQSYSISIPRELCDNTLIWIVHFGFNLNINDSTPVIKIFLREI